MAAGTPPWAYPDNETTTDAHLPTHVDVAIIGAGLTGLGAARALAGSGASVAVIESDRVGAGATRHSLGVVAAHYPGGPHRVMRRIGSGKATALWIAAQQAMADIGDAIDFDPVSLVEMGRRPADTVRLEADATWLTERGLDARFDADAGRLVSQAGIVDPLDLATSLADTVMKDGGVLCEGVTATSLSRHTGGYQVLTNAGKISADAAIVTAGAAPAHVGVPAPDRTVRPADRYGAVMRIDGLEPSLDRFEVIRSGGLTVRRLDATRIMVGAHLGLETGLDPNLAAERLAAMVAQRCGGMGDPRIEFGWSVTTGLTADGIPHVWRSDGIWFAGGYNGDAIVPGMAVGTQIGQVLAGERTQTIFAGAVPASGRRLRGSRKLAAAIERWRG